MRLGFVMARESLLFAVGQEELAPEPRATRTALPPVARWCVRQGRAERLGTGGPGRMNHTICTFN